VGGVLFPFCQKTLAILVKQNPDLNSLEQGVDSLRSLSIHHCSFHINYTGIQKKTFFELFQICELILNVLRLLNSKMNSVSLYHIKIICNITIFVQKWQKCYLNTALVS